MLGAYFVLLPNARVLTAIFFILIFFQELPAVLFLGLWFVFQLWQGGFAIVQPEAGGGVAFFAHIGGFLFGVLTVRLVAVRRPLMPRFLGLLSAGQVSRYVTRTESGASHGCLS